MAVEPSRLIDEKTYPEDPLVGIFYHGSLSQKSDDTFQSFEPPKTKLYITDPPYNIGFKYGPGVNDSLTEEEYAELLNNTMKRCYETSTDDAHLFLIHYPEVIAKHWSILTTYWDFQQWITWVYPANIGHSKKKWTTAQRAVIWLRKGNPTFKQRGVTQEFKNPSVAVVQKKKAEGVKGVGLYDWWEIDLCKNVSDDYKGYENQIPYELIRRIILCASEPGDWVGDPFGGSFSTARSALKLGRRGWGCDINPEVQKFWPVEEEWFPRKNDPILPNVDTSKFDQVLNYIPREQLDNALFKLLKNASLGDLTKHVGRVNGPRIYELFHGKIPKSIEIAETTQIKFKFEND